MSLLDIYSMTVLNINPVECVLQKNLCEIIWWQNINQKKIKQQFIYNDSIYELVTNKWNIYFRNFKR